MGHKKPDPKYLVQGLAGPRYKPEQGLPAAIAPPVEGLGGAIAPVEGLGGASYPQGKDPVQLVGATVPLVGATVPLVGARYPPAQGLVGAPPPRLEGARLPPAQGLARGVGVSFEQGSPVAAPVQGFPPAKQPLPLLPAAVNPVYPLRALPAAGHR